MTTAKELARQLGVNTADQIAERPPAKPTPDDHDKRRARWGIVEKKIFKALDASATYISGSKQFVSVTVHNEDGTTTRFGHNRPQRPVRVGTTGSWQDRVTATENRNPYFWQGLLMRIWTPAEVYSKKLAVLVTEALMPLGEPSELMNRFVALSDEVDLAVLERELHIMAWQQGIPTWSDDNLSSEIEYARTKFGVRLDDPKTIRRAVDFIINRGQAALTARVEGGRS